MEVETVISLIGSLGLPGAILILLIFLANKHLPNLVRHFQAMETQLTVLATSIQLLIQRIDKNSK